MEDEWSIEFINNNYALILIINNNKYVVMDGFDSIDALLRYYNKLIEGL